MPHPGKVDVEKGHLFFGAMTALGTALCLLMDAVGLLHVLRLSQQISYSGLANVVPTMIVTENLSLP